MIFPHLATIATTDVITLPPTATIGDAVRAMEERDVHTVVVVTPRGYRLFSSARLLDFKSRGHDLQTPLDELDLPWAITLDPDASVLDGLRAIQNHSEFIGLEDRAGELRGIVNYSDLTGSLDPRVLARHQNLGELLQHDPARDGLTEKKSAAQNQRREHEFFTGGPVVVFVWHPEPGWPVHYVSPNVEQVLGYSAGEILAPDFHFADLVHPDDMAWLGDEVTSHLARGETGFEQHYRLRTRSGDYRWFYDYTAPDYDDQGQPRLIRGYILDRTEERQAQERIAENEERWRFVLEATEQGVWDWDASTGSVYFSPQWKHMLGHEEYEVGTSLDEWKSRVHPDDLDHCLADLDRHFRGETATYENEHRVRCKDGSYKWILDRGRVVQRDDDGQPLRVIGSHTDMTERHHLFENLEKQESRFRTLFDLYPDATVLIDPESGLPVQFNRLAHEQLGYTAEEFGRLRIPDYEAQETPEETAEHIRTILTRGRDDFETQHRCKDGSVIDVEVTVILLSLDERTLFLTVFRNITRQKQALRDLAESEKRFMDVSMAAGEYIWEIDSEGRYSIVTSPAEALLGYPVEEIIGRSPFDFMPEGEAERVQDRLNEWATNKSSWQGLEHVSIRPDGSLVHQRVSGLPVLDEDGNLNGFRGTGRDITAEKEAEQAQKALTERLHLATSAAELGIWDYDVASGRLEWDDGMFRLYGIDPANFGHAFEDWAGALMPESRETAVAIFQAAVESDEPFDVQIAIRRADDGTIRTLHGQAQVIRDDAGKATRIVGVNRDITATRQAQKESERAREQAEQASRAKSETSDKWVLPCAEPNLQQPSSLLFPAQK
ncbi:MAG: PAS domain-containing protein [Thiohalospira sp.]